MTQKRLKESNDYIIPDKIPADLKGGDMPGDKLLITPLLVKKATAIFPLVADFVSHKSQTEKAPKIVMSIFGGSGVGKSEIATLLSYFLEVNGWNCYVLSGDNYPYRFWDKNNEERLRCYRHQALAALLTQGLYTEQVKNDLEKLWVNLEDFDEKLIVDYPYLEVYQKYGKQGMRAFLGSEKEMEYAFINKVFQDFKNHKEQLMLKRMQMGSHLLWYEEVSFKTIDIIILEWVHGNSLHLEGIDYRIFLNSTPQETRAHRTDRKRDSYKDDPFALTILGIEDAQTREHLELADIIMSNQAELLTFKQYQQLMAEVGYQDCF